MSKAAPKGLLFIFITLLLDIIGLGIIIPVVPELIEQLIHGGINDAAKIGGWLTFAYAIMQFFCAPIIGNLSDQFGRRPVLLFSLIGFGFDYLLLALSPSIAWLFVGRLIAGITGASITTASAYIADVSTPENRSQNFGLIGVAFGIGFIVGPVLGGVLGDYGARLPFYVAAALCFANALYGYFVLPESLPVENRRPFSWKRANPVGTLRQLNKYPKVLGLVASLVLIYIASHAIQSNWNFYTIFKFQWTAKQVGYSLGFVGILVGLTQGGLIRIVIPKFGQAKSIYIGLFLYCIGFTLFAFAWEGWMMYVFMIPYALGGIAGPALQGYMSSQVPANEQGELQGGLTSLMSATAIVGPPLMTNLFAYFSKPNPLVVFPGAHFLMAALLTLASAILAMRSVKK
ncbi:MAG: MFS transporter [Bacteroidetes bacterium]|nr:MAG: MFS transporter [Bacteroidota bacterium]